MTLSNGVLSEFSWDIGDQSIPHTGVFAYRCEELCQRIDEKSYRVDVNSGFILVSDKDILILAFYDWCVYAACDFYFGFVLLLIGGLLVFFISSYEKEIGDSD